MGALFKIKGFSPYVAMLFLNAFVDLGHKIVIQNTVFKIYDGQTQIVLTAFVNALILLPFVMLYTPAGYVGDKYPKHQVMRYSAWATVALTLLLTFFYYQGWFWPAFGMTFLLAVQSAFYSPAKFGYIRELVGKNSLAAANGVVQATTTVAILSGIFIFSVIFETFLADQVTTTPTALLMDIAPIGYFLVLAALVEITLAYRLPKTQEVDISKRFDWRKYRRAVYIRANLRTVTSHKTILLSIVGLSIFWSISQVMIAAFPAFAKATLGENNTVVIQGILACTGFGIVVGSMIAGRISRGHIETGLIPIGSFGIAIGVLLVPFLDNAPTLAAVFFGLGIFGGLFIIPLNALIQFHGHENDIGVILAGNNFIQNVAMLSFLALTVSFSIYGLPVERLLGLLAIVALAGAVYTLYRLPQALARFVFTAAIARAYRLEVLGFKNIPESGGVLMLGNQISRIDWAILQMSCPRPLRFLMERSMYSRWFLRPFMDFFGAIPISRGSDREAIRSITDALNTGDVVCLFPGGTISRTGELSGFQHGYQLAAKNADGVILPFYLDGIWDDVFSHLSSRAKILSRSTAERNLIVAFGKPLPMNTSATDLKQNLFELSIDSWRRNDIHHHDGN